MPHVSSHNVYSELFIHSIGKIHIIGYILFRTTLLFLTDY